MSHLHRPWVVAIVAGISLVGAAGATGEGPAATESPPRGSAAAGEDEAEGGGSEPDEPEEEPRKVDLILQGEEPDRWRLDLGGGWNENDGLYGRVALSNRNFLGRGEAFGVALEHGDEHELYEIEYRMPFLFGRRQSLGVSLFHDATDHPVAGGADFGRRRDGGSLSYGRRFGARQSLDLGYRFADVDESESLLRSRR